MKEPKIIYEPHPVTPARKAELVAQGYAIIDAQFKPVGVVVDEPDEIALIEATKPQRKRSGLDDE